VSWSPVIGASIYKVDVVAQNHKSVREADRYPEHGMVLVRQYASYPASKCRRASPEVNGYIKYRSADDTHEFPLRLVDLVVQASEDVACRAALIILNEICMDARSGKFSPLPGFEEITPRICEDGGLNQ